MRTFIDVRNTRSASQKKPRPLGCVNIEPYDVMTS